MKDKSGTRLRVLSYAVALLLVLVGFFVLSRHNYLLFHCLVELSTVIVGVTLFLVSWNTRKFNDNGNFTFLGIAYFFVAILDLLHTLSYQGMPIFAAHTDYATELWIATRYLESVSLLLFACCQFRKNDMTSYVLFPVYSAVSVLLVLSIFYWHVFPECFQEGVGLTPFKKVSEYTISTILATSLFFLWRRRTTYHGLVFRYLVSSIVATIVAELLFTVYADVYGITNVLGHIVKFVSFYFVYRAVIETGLNNPWSIIFRQAKEREELLSQTEELAAIGGWEWDCQESQLTLSPQIARMFGCDGQDAQLSESAFYSYFSKGDQALIRQIIKDGNLTRTPVDREFLIQREDGSHNWIRLTGELKKQDGRPLKVVGFIQDINSKKKEQELQDDMDRILRHDLRSPICFIFTHAHLLSTIGFDDQDLQKEGLELIRKTAKKSLNMIEVYFDLSKIEQGTYKLSTEPLDFAKLMEEIKAELNALLTSNRSKLVVRPDPNHPCLSFTGEEVLILTMLTNLIKNAVEASPRESDVSVTVTVDDSIRIDIHNAGAVPESIRDGFFNKYVSSKKDNNIGLGTYSAKLIAEVHDGSITMKTDEVKGTTLSIQLPIERLVEKSG